MQRIIRIVLILIATQGGSSALAEETRPKVGLVLGGGGALGFAHIGVLKVLEEEQIPIDYIGGTSIGAIVAGMYASGMSPAEIEHQFISLNWWQVLRDQSPHQFLDYRKKLEDKQFMGMEFGLKNWKPVFSPGVAYGQKLNNILETFTINSAGITDFDKLNIPYRAIATDLRSGTPVALDSGSLAQAMRASMAVPGAFTPVRLNDMVLVDGGILNNMPVDVVKGMGADIIIAVDAGASSAEHHKESDFRSLRDVAARSYSLMQRPAQEKQLEGANVVIAPLLSDFSPSHFHKAAEIIPAGETAAGLIRKQLAPYGVDKTTFENYLKKQRQVHTEEITISEIRISGNDTVSDTVIRSRIKTQTGPLQLDTVYEDLNRIYGMGDFQTVTYDLIPTNSSYELEYKTAEKFWGPTYLHFGMKLEVASDATTLWSLLLNYTRSQLNPLGGEVRLDIEGGGHKRLILGEWYQPISQSGRFFIAPAAGYSSEDVDVYLNNTVVADVEQQLSLGAVDVGVSGFEYGELRLGLLGGHANVKGYSGLISLDEIDDTIASATTALRLDQLDDAIFPTKGYQLELDGMFAFEEMGSSETFSKLEFQALAPVTRGPHSLIPKLSLGSSLGTELPFYALFDAGGIDSFAGYAPYQLRGNYYGIGNLSYRYRLGRLPPAFGHGIFAVLRIDAGNAWFDASDARLENIDYGGLVGLGADTILGTCKIAIGKAESTSPRLYFTVGNEF